MKMKEREAKDGRSEGGGSLRIIWEKLKGIINIYEMDASTLEK